MKRKTSNFIKVYQNNKAIILAVTLIIIVSGLIIANNILKPEYIDVYNGKPVKGEETATVMLTEFSDYQCPACKSAYFVVEGLLDEYAKDVKLEYKHFPLRTIHPNAQKAAEAAECANDQGKFWEYSDILFKNSPALSRSNLKTYAKELSLDSVSFDACLDSGAKEIIVNTDYAEALSLGLRGTPSFFVNGKEMEWVQGLSLYDNLKTMIETELNTGTSSN